MKTSVCLQYSLCVQSRMNRHSGRKTSLNVIRVVFIFISSYVLRPFLCASHSSPQLCDDLRDVSDV